MTLQRADALGRLRRERRCWPCRAACCCCSGWCRPGRRRCWRPSIRSPGRLRPALQPPNAVHLVRHRQFRPRRALADDLAAPARSPDGASSACSFPSSSAPPSALASGYFGGIVDAAADAPARRHLWPFPSSCSSSPSSPRSGPALTNFYIASRWSAGSPIARLVRARGAGAEAGGFRAWRRAAWASASRASCFAISCPMRSCRPSSSRCPMR